MQNRLLCNGFDNPTVAYMKTINTKIDIPHLTYNQYSGITYSNSDIYVVYVRTLPNKSV